MEYWQLQDAKNRFSEVVSKALHEGPQVVTRRGRKTVVILSIEDYQRLVGPKESLAAFFEKSPLRGVGIDLNRCKDKAREVEL